VQDFAAVEVHVLLDCLDRNQSITLAGDTQQHVIETSGFRSWGALLQSLGLPGASVETLRISYRTTREILDFAFSLLGDLRENGDPPTATRSGPPVELFRFTDRGGCVAFLADAMHHPDSALARRLLHVGATRAIDQLWLACVGAPSPLLASLARSA